METSAAIDLSLQAGDAPGMLPFTGAQTIAGVEAAHAALREALATAQGRLVVDCRAVTDVDFAFLQLLLAARRSAREDGKTLSVLPPDGGLFETMLAAAGLAAGADGGDETFWNEGEG